MIASLLAVLLMIAGLGTQNARQAGGSEPIFAAQKDGRAGPAGGSEPIWAAQRHSRTHADGGSEPIFASKR